MVATIRLTRLFLWTLPLLILFPVMGALQESPVSTARVLTVDGAIGPATSDYLTRGIADANAEGVDLIVIEMDTPGGLDLSMRDIIQAILQSDTPVATYVSPQGARAASAGTYILYASHIAAMAPATNLGAATPVQLGAPSLAEPESEPEAGAESASEENGQQEAESPVAGSAMERKVINDAMAYIRSLAEQSGRNAEWAEAAVRDAATLSAREALDMNVVDIVAANIDDLLAQLDGWQITVNDLARVLSTGEMRIEYQPPDWRMEFLEVITNPNLILILGMIGVYGLIIEFYNPGFGFAGVMGAICLLLAGYGLQLLPLNYAGLGLVILGLILIVSEAFMPSFGILGVGGVISFVIGSVILVDTEVDVFQVSLPLVLAFAVVAAGLLVWTIQTFMRVKVGATVSGLQTMIGMEGITMDDFEQSGMIKVQGELWRAKSADTLHHGDKVKVVNVNGLELTVEKI